MAKNDITGDTIKSKPSTNAYLSNYDKAFRKKTAYEWAKDIGVVIMDADGFRWNDGVTVETPITYKEFNKRIGYCTISGYHNLL